MKKQKIIFNINNQNVFQKKEILNILDNIYNNISFTLDIFDEFPEINVEFYNGMSQVLNNKIYIDEKFLSKEVFFKKVFSHELIHLLIFSKYGQLNAFLDEGIAAYFADNQYYKTEFKFDVHEFCKCLLKHNLIYPVRLIMDNVRYYGRRHDFRVDFQSASFTGFIIEKYGIEKYYKMYSEIINPTNENPEYNLYKVISNIYGKKINELEDEWTDFLSSQVKYNKITERFISGKRFFKRIPIKKYHCSACCYPLEEKNSICIECNFDNSKKIKFL